MAFVFLKNQLFCKKYYSEKMSELKKSVSHRLALLFFSFYECINVAECFFCMWHNAGSYTQGRTAGDFLSSRKAARAERCPPKTTAAALDG